MATKMGYALREDKEEIQRQFGCMNGIFQLFDRRYLHGQHWHSRNQRRSTLGQGDNGQKEFKNASENAKEKNPKNVTIEKNRASIESSRNSFSSSCSSTTFSSLDCSKRVQTELSQTVFEPTSPNVHKKQPNFLSIQALDIRDVVKDSMTRETRVVSVRKYERAGSGPVMKHVDSPRPFVHQKQVQYDRKDRNLAIKDKEMSRFSCDGRELRCSVKSTLKVKEVPRLSLDSKQNNLRKSMDEPGSNKRPLASVVARLMGLEGLTDPIDEAETFKKKEGQVRPKNGSTSVYGEMAKRLTELEFKTSGKDLRALKQILEAMQKTGGVLEKNEQIPVYRKSDQPVFRAIKVTSAAVKPPKTTADDTKDFFGTEQVKHQTQQSKKLNGMIQKNMPEYLTGEKSGLSPRRQRSKDGGEKKCIRGSSSDLGRIKKRADIQPVLSDLKTRNLKNKPINSWKNNERSCGYSIETRTLKQDHDTVSFKSKRNTSQNEPEVIKTENHTDNFEERMIEDKPMIELTKLTVEQQSPVSVLDAFYTEDTPSPVKNKSNNFNDYENSHFDETEWNQVEISDIKLENRSHLVHQIELPNSTNYEAKATELYRCENKNGDHIYIREIILASGFLKDLNHTTRMVQLHPIGTLIDPGLFHVLEKTKERTQYEKIRRKMVFDTVNDILFHKLAMLGSLGISKRQGRVLNGEKLEKELCLEIDNLQISSERCIFDEDGEVKELVNIDVNKKSEDWDECCHEVPGLVLDIERLIFKDLISDFVNAEVGSLQGLSGRHCRQLFSM